jgi:hypothetical protein
MPRYYLDIVIGDERIVDEDGFELRDATAARGKALEEVRALLSSRIVNLLDPKDCHVEINDQSRNLLFTIDATEAYKA